MNRVVLSLCITAFAVSAAHADEGMWLYTNPPREILKNKYKFEPDAKWLEHLQKSSVRFASGGSGSFVSPDGLVMTNHHVGLSVLQQISKPGGKNYVKDGFWAQTHDKEVKAEQEELNVLMTIQDVTKEVNNAVKGDLSPEKAAEARRAAISGIEKDGLEKAKKDGIDPAHTEVVTLYNGNQFHLYTYKKYTDVRLVFAPEQQIAFYGGDPDNFEYPRFDLDMCFFRVYENDKPVKVEHYLKWSKDGAKDNELIFVSGHPGHTDRLNTVADLEYQRDRTYPFSLQLLNRMEVAYSIYSERSDENARRAKSTLFGVQNSRKARQYGLEGLLDPAIMNKKKEQEKKLRAAVKENPELKEAAGAWDKIAAVQKTLGQNSVRYNMLEGGRGFNSSLFGIARVLLRAGEELPKPNGDRLREYSDSNIDAMKDRLFSGAPIYEDFEIVKLTDSLTFLANQLGADSEIVKKVLAGKSPAERAAELVGTTKLLKEGMLPGRDGKVARVKNVALIQELFKGGKDAVAKAHDPMIELARLIDEESRKVRKTVEAQNEIKERAYDQIAKAKFAIEGTNTYPDATFTLRLAFGVVKGYEENGKHVPFETTFAGLYGRSAEHKDKPPFDLPELWVKRKDKLDLSTPFNFVCTADIIGGNSGSPVVNREGEVVGLIFDGNLQSLVLDYVFTEDQARAVAVHSKGIIEALRKVYDADSLADEITGKKK
jgi:hypothetical protein